VIVAMNLRLTVQPPEPPQVEPSPGPAEEPESDRVEGPDPPRDDINQPGTELPENEPALTSETVVDTEGLTYPPQMMPAIRAQEIALWKLAYDELGRLGVTNVPAPPA
jgi:hypothetical protein